MWFSGETTGAVASVKTYINDGKLVIEREGMTISFGNSRMAFHGSVGSFVMGNIVNGKPMGTSISQGNVVVGVALLGLQQASLDLEIEDSGDITAYGQVAHLEVEINGSGDVDASKLIADRASLSVAGSGEILVRGNPPGRDHSVAGSGKIKFRQEMQHESSNQSTDRTRAASAG